MLRNAKNHFKKLVTDFLNHTQWNKQILMV